MTAPGTKLVAEILQTPGGTLIIRTKNGHDLKLSLAAVTRRQADGSFTLEPLGTWITVGEAARIMGVHECSVLRLQDLIRPDGSPVVQFRRPTAFRVQVLLSSLLDHLENAKDPEFWPSCKPAEHVVQSR
jgi:hypothetical protein